MPEPLGPTITAISPRSAGIEASWTAVTGPCGLGKDRERFSAMTGGNVDTAVLDGAVAAITTPLGKPCLTRKSGLSECAGRN